MDSGSVHRRPLRATEGRIHKDHVEKVWGTLRKQPAVGLVAGQGVAMPNVRLVNPVQYARLARTMGYIRFSFSRP